MLISIFIPTYNSSKTIASTIDCILNQTYKEIEICLVDDCSTDNTVDILREYAQKYNNVKYIVKEKNGGFVPDSWNRVFPILQGEFTFYMSHDDSLSPDCIEWLVRTQQETGADTVIPDCVFTYEDGRQVSSFEGKFNCSFPLTLSSKSAFAQMLNYDIPGFALWRTSLIKKIGMPSEAFNSDEGMQRIWTLISNKVVVEKTAKFYYFITSGSITKGLKPYHLSGLKTQQRLIKELFKHFIFFQFPRQALRFILQYLRSYIYLKRKI